MPMKLQCKAEINKGVQSASHFIHESNLNYDDIEYLFLPTQFLKLKQWM